MSDARPLRLVLPCYDEAPNLAALVARAVACAQRRGLGPSDFELICVDNGSRDATPEVLAEIAAAPGGEYLRVVTVPENRGYGYGLATGLRAAGPGLLAISHADQQCDPEDAFRAWEQLEALGPGVLVKGRRHGRALRERVVSRGLELTAAALLGRRLSEINAQPKVFPSELVAALTDPPDDFTFDLYLLLRARALGYRVASIDVRFPPRVHGQSRWSATARSRARTIARFVRYLVVLRRRGPPW